eukprot:8492637-Pyramimonas_sp.AAC.1
MRSLSASESPRDWETTKFLDVALPWGCIPVPNSLQLVPNLGGTRPVVTPCHEQVPWLIVLAVGTAFHTVNDRHSCTGWALNLAAHESMAMHKEG